MLKGIKMDLKKWRVVVTSECEAEIERTVFSNEERFIIASWIRFVEVKGPYSLNDFEVFQFNDHELTRQRKWNKHRSSSFSKAGRIIYRIDDDIITVIVVRITRNHNYS